MNPAPVNLPVAILAGGLATRLQPITAKIPKLLVEVAGEPFFAHQLRLLRAQGLTRVVVCAGHLGEQIVQQFGNGAAHGVQIEYSFDGPKLLGTGGALVRALPLLGDAFYVLYGDSYLPIDYHAAGRAFTAAGRAALMTVFENRGAYDTSNVWFEHGHLRAYSKRHRTPAMRHIDYGLGVFSRRAFADCPPDTVVDLAALQETLCQRGELTGLEVKDRFYEIGSPTGLQELDTLLRAQKI